MVYQLTRPAGHEAMRQGAALMPQAEADVLLPYPDPYLVWAPGLPDAVTLHNECRSLTWAVHNAGGSSCRVTGLTVDVPWLTATCAATDLPPDGLPVSMTLGLVPDASLKPGAHPARVTLSVAGPGGTHRELTRTLTLRVPDAPIPWFDAPQPAFEGLWTERPVTVASHHPVQVQYRVHKITDLPGKGTVPLFPAEYRLEGTKHDIAMVDIPGLPTVPVSVPGNFQVPGPMVRNRLTNLGARPLAGRLVATAPWLVVKPEQVALAPGESLTVTLECRDDGRYWSDEPATVELHATYADEALACLPVARRLTAPGPRPVLPPGPLELPAVAPGETASAAVPIRNAGTVPLVVRSEFSSQHLRAQPGEAVRLDLKVGRPYTELPGKVARSTVAVTSALLPYWRYLSIPYTLDVVQATVLSRHLDFGAVKYTDQKLLNLKVQRSDNRRAKLAVRFPPDLAETFTLSGERLIMRNMQPRPVKVDGEYEVVDQALGGAVLGTVHITGQCLVPKLEVRMPAVALVPGQSQTVHIPVIDAGGGLELGKVVSSRPEWATVRRREMKVTVDVTTTFWERGTKTVTLTFYSNDFVAPEQDHVLTVQLLPTRTMQVLDVLRWLVSPLWKLIRPLWVRLEPHWRKVEPQVRMVIDDLMRSLRARR